MTQSRRIPNNRVWSQGLLVPTNATTSSKLKGEHKPAAGLSPSSNPGVAAAQASPFTSHHQTSRVFQHNHHSCDKSKPADSVPSDFSSENNKPHSHHCHSPGASTFYMLYESHLSVTAQVFPCRSFQAPSLGISTVLCFIFLHILSKQSFRIVSGLQVTGTALKSTI